jgi:hypothetical protein
MLDIKNTHQLHASRGGFTLVGCVPKVQNSNKSVASLICGIKFSCSYLFIHISDTYFTHYLKLQV